MAMSSARNSLANSAVAQLLLGYSSPTEESKTTGVDKISSVTATKQSMETVSDNKDVLNERPKPPRKRKREYIERKQHEMENEKKSLHSSDTDEDTSKSTSDPGDCSSGSERSELRCPMCSFVAVNDEEFRSHFLFHRRALSGVGRYQHPMWVASRRRTVSDSPLLLSSTCADFQGSDSEDKEYSLKELLTGPRKPASLASSYLRNIVASMSAKTEVPYGPLQEARSPSTSVCSDTTRPADTLRTEVKQETRGHGSADSQHEGPMSPTLSLDLKEDPSSDSRSPASVSTTISVGRETFSPTAARWHSSSSPDTMSSPNQSRSDEAPSFPKRPCPDEALTRSGYPQPIDLSSGPRQEINNEILPLSSRLKDAAIQCELLKSVKDAHTLQQSLPPQTEAEVTSSSLQYRCPFCCIAFEDEVLFSIHMGCHSHNDPFLCNVCGKRTVNKYAFYTHIMRGHSCNF